MGRVQVGVKPSLELGVFSGALRDWQPEQIASAASAVGLDTLEWEVGAGDRAHISLGSFERDAGHCAQVSQGAGLSICGICGDDSLSILSYEDVSSLVSASTAAGVAQARMYAPAPVRDTSIRAQLDALREALRGYEPLLQASGTTLLIELSQETLIPSPELFLRVCGDLSPDRYAILYDPSNMLSEGNLEPRFAIDLMGEYLKSVHVKNERFVEGASGWSSQIAEIDRGLVDWRALFRELELADYTGAVVIDHLSGPTDEARLKGDVATARRLWEERRPTNAA
jgi:sugar phosphate isomerase/epimerase